jgi:hypothetical protein
MQGHDRAKEVRQAPASGKRGGAIGFWSVHSEVVSEGLSPRDPVSVESGSLVRPQVNVNTCSGLVRACDMEQGQWDRI